MLFLVLYLHIKTIVDHVIKNHINNNYHVLKSDKILRFAVIKNLEIIAEAAYLLTKDFKANNSNIEWNDMIGMRHILVHGYYQIKDDIIWATIETELSPLKDKILRIIQ